jgi:hypothetical protein
VASIKAASLENTRIFELILRTRATGELVTTTVSFTA